MEERDDFSSRFIGGFLPSKGNIARKGERNKLHFLEASIVRHRDKLGT